jgi:hypothetical protein
MSKCPIIWTRSHVFKNQVEKNKFPKFTCTKSIVVIGLKHVPRTFPRHHNRWYSPITIMEDAYIYKIAKQSPQQQCKGNMT